MTVTVLPGQERAVSGYVLCNSTISDQVLDPIAGSELTILTKTVLIVYLVNCKS
jgi:hypothetical protein